MARKVSKNRKLVRVKPKKILPKKPKRISKKKSYNSLKINGLQDYKSLEPRLISEDFRALNDPIPKKSISNQYGDNKIVVLVRDPWWLFAYWEIAPQREKEVVGEIEKANLRREKTVLRVYEVTGTIPEKPNHYFDIELNFLADHWYVDVGAPARDWVVDIGIRTTQGRFFVLARSNRVTTPRFGPSNVLDEEWMLPEDITLKLFGLSGMEQRTAGSLDFRKLWGFWGRSSDLNRKNLNL